MQFGTWSYNLKEGRERTGHVGVRPTNEHSLHVSKLGLKLMHGNLTVSPSLDDYPLGQQCDPDPRGHAA